jgi:hypothetical protein
MGRHKKIIQVISVEGGITLNSYLSNHSTQRNLDKIIISWYQKNDGSNPKLLKEQWDSIIKTFHDETER